MICPAPPDWLLLCLIGLTVGFLAFVGWLPMDRAAWFGNEQEYYEDGEHE